MAKADVKPTVYKGSRGYYSGGSTYHYDDEGRGSSKQVWEWFEENFRAANYEAEWLFSHDDNRYYWLLKSSTYRYGLMDIAFERAPGWEPHSDSRAHRLVIKHHNEQVWVEFHAAMVEAYKRHKAEQQRVEQQRAEERDGKYAAYRAQREAERIKVEREDWEEITQAVDPVVGYFQSELAQNFDDVERSGANQGDFIDDVVSVYTDGQGWGYEMQRAVGRKLQITVSLDLSNSMYYNAVHQVAATTFRDICLALENMRAMWPEDLFTAYLVFSQDGWAGAGKRVQRWAPPEMNTEKPLFNDFAAIRPSHIKAWYDSGIFDGTDTWFEPLFAAIEEWENENSDPGATRLDIIITDAVVEHKVDIQRADVIQERRNGALQSVMLNFLPENEWAGSTLPRRCFSVAVDKDNVGGILRSVMSEFLAVSI